MTDSAREHELPVGTITFLFTDIEGSTQPVGVTGDGVGADRQVLAHHALDRSAEA